MFRVLIVVMALLYASLSYAGPAFPELLTASQPSGTSFKVKLHGVEKHNWVTTEDGYVIKRNKFQQWEYAISVNGGIRTSGRLVGEGEGPYQGVQNSFREPETAIVATDQTGTTSVGDWVPFQVSGIRKILVIMVSFSNKALTTTAANWGASVFSTTAGAKSVANYYKDNSFNTLLITPVSHTQAGNPAGVVTVNVPYVHPYNGTAENVWVAAAINAAASYVDFSSLDADDNGYIDRTEAFVYLVPAGYEGSGSTKTPNVWSHSTAYASTGLSAAGKLFPVYAMSGELNNVDHQQPIGTVVHEVGQQICGLPDLYDVSGHNAGMGWFSPMAAGSWGFNVGEDPGTTPVVMDAWSREYLGWATPAVPSSSSSFSLGLPLSAKSAAFKFISPLASDTEYFLAENRFPSGWDLGLRGLLGSDWSGGVLITHNDIKAGTLGNNDINSYVVNSVGAGGHQGVVPVQASVTNCNMLTDGSTCRGHATTLFYAGNNSSWETSTTPNSKYYSGESTEFGLSGISAPATTVTGSLFVPSSQKTVSISIVTTTAGSVVGGGTVTGAGGLSCQSSAGLVTGVCGSTFEAGTAISLIAVPDAGSVFTGWTGGVCSGTSACDFTLAANTSIVATFNAAWKAKVGGTGYDSLASAYAAAVDGSIILLRSTDFDGGLTIDKAVSILGGYNTDFVTTNDSFSTVSGVLTIGTGSVVVDRLTIK